MNIDITFQAYAVKPEDPSGRLLRAGIETPSAAQAWMLHYERLLNYVEAAEGVRVEIRVHPTGNVFGKLGLEALADEWNADNRRKQAHATLVR